MIKSELDDQVELDDKVEVDDQVELDDKVEVDDGKGNPLRLTTGVDN